MTYGGVKMKNIPRTSTCTIIYNNPLELSQHAW